MTGHHHNFIYYSTIFPFMYPVIYHMLNFHLNIHSNVAKVNKYKKKNFPFRLFISGEWGQFGQYVSGFQLKYVNNTLKGPNDPNLFKYVSRHFIN